MDEYVDGWVGEVGVVRVLGGVTVHVVICVEERDLRGKIDLNENQPSLDIVFKGFRGRGTYQLPEACPQGTFLFECGAGPHDGLDVGKEDWHSRSKPRRICGTRLLYRPINFILGLGRRVQISKLDPGPAVYQGRWSHLY